MKILKKYARAKINLGLQVLNKQKDGYHNINTIFRTIDLYDELVFEVIADRIISTTMDSEIPKENNLIYKAIKSIQDLKCIDFGVNVKVKKMIPSGAGLGGGSSNAATTLKAINILFDLRLTNEQLFSLAVKLGSDVPFFLRYGTAEGRHRGEILDYFNVYLPYYILLVYPEIHVSTKVAYESLYRTVEQVFEARDYKHLIQQSSNKPRLLIDHLINDFEKTVFMIHPEILEIKNELYSSGAVYASMSGSGSTIFGLYMDYKSAYMAKSRFTHCFTHISYPGY